MPPDVEAALAHYVIAMVDLLAGMCRTGAPRAAVILAACALKLREEYPAEENGPEA